MDLAGQSVQVIERTSSESLAIRVTPDAGLVLVQEGQLTSGGLLPDLMRLQNQ